MDASLAHYRLRPDLSWTRRATEGRVRWLVRDPLTFDHFLVTSRERTIAHLIDRCDTLDQLLAEFREAHPFQELSAASCLRFINKLCGLGIVLDGRRGQAIQQRRRKKALQKKSRLLQLLTPLYLRLPGMDASWLLRRIDWISRFLFHPLAIVTVLVAFGVLFGFVMSHLDAIAGRFLEHASYLTARDALLILGVFVVVKVFHELGHALACRYYGADCHEIGVLLLVLTPCLYCDVTDAWRLSSRWRRLFIAAAGMYVELMISVAAMVVWLNTVPSELNSLAFSTLLVCSVGTVLVNINPLIRYDGYYMLTDLTDIPNLSSQANEVLDRRIVKWFAYRDAAPVSQDGSDAFLLSYAIAALTYRTLIIVAIAWMLLTLGELYHVEPLAWVAVTAMVLGVLWKVKQSMTNIYRRVRLGGVRPIRTLTTGLVAATLLALLFLPYSSYVNVVGVLDATGSTPIYATQTGHIDHSVEEGTRVRRGETIAVIRNYEIDLKVETLATKLRAAAVQERHLVDRSTIDDSAAGELAQLRSRMNQLREQLATVKDQQQSLEIKSPCNGRVVAAPWKETRGDSLRRLAGWSGSALTAANRQCLVERGELLCHVVPENDAKAVFYVPDDTIDLVKARSAADVRLTALPRKTFRGRVNDISTVAVDDLPLSLADRIPFSTVDGLAKPLEPHFQVAVRIEDAVPPANFRGVLHGRIAMQPMSLAARCARYLASIWRQR